VRRLASPGIPVYASAEPSGPTRVEKVVVGRDLMEI
jgi:hypothetical protein